MPNKPIRNSRGKTTKSHRATKQRQQWSIGSILKSPAFTIFAIFGIVIIGMALTKEIIHKIEVRKQISGLEVEIAQLEQQNSELSDLMDYFQSSSYLEKEAREKLGLKTNGENVVIIPQTSNNLNNVDNQETASAQTTSSQVSNPIKWKQYFFN